MSLALDEDMWSRAAEEARKLIALGAGSPRTLEFALAGLCQSDFEEEKALLRRQIPPRTYNEICSQGSASPAAAASPPPAVPSPPAAPAPVPEGAAPTAPGAPGAPGAPAAPVATRLGVALLIGNWDYGSAPLNSVKNDLEGMGKTLESLGFTVTVKENLRTPRQFAEALDQVLERDARPEDVLFVYYSGHGVQLDGKAQFLTTGVSATAQVAEDVRDNAQSAEGLLAQMERSLPGTRILLVEACRNDVFSPRASVGAQAARGGFAFQQDDVSNTFVMFANKPGLPTPVRSDTGLMGPFTEAFLYALQNAPTGEILEVYDVAAKKAAELSPGQEPVLYRSRDTVPVVLRRADQKLQDTRAKDLLNAAEPLYGSRAWDQFRLTVNRGRALAADPAVQLRLTQEVAFADLVLAAEAAEGRRRWPDAATSWQTAAELFPAREWVAMKAAAAFLLADDLARAVRSLAVLATQSDSETAAQAKAMLAGLVKAFPEQEAAARKAAEGAARVSGPEFERFQDEE
jgi:hypothetical protein